MERYDPIDILREQHLQVMDSLQVLLVSLEGLSEEILTLGTLELLLGAAEEVRGRTGPTANTFRPSCFPCLGPSSMEMKSFKPSFGSIKPFTGASPGWSG